MIPISSSHSASPAMHNATSTPSSLASKPQGSPQNGDWSPLVDAYGRPIDSAALRVHDLTAPTTNGLRRSQYESISAGLSPGRLAAILRSADDNDSEAFLTLAEELEEKDAHYRSVLSTRKLAVAGLQAVIECPTESSSSIADEVTQLVQSAAFPDLLADLLDALGKGFSVVEINWDVEERFWWPRWQWRDPRWFQFDQLSQRAIRIRHADHPAGLVLPPYKFVCHVPRLKAGLPIRGGLARLAAWAWLFKAFTIKDWLAFIEVYGMPLRIGRYARGASDEDIQSLRRALFHLGSDAAAVLHEDTSIEFQGAVQGAGNNDLFRVAAEFWDRQLSKAVLGQTASTEGTPGRLGGERAQDEVRHDLRQADARQLAATLQRDLIRPFVDLNFGRQRRYPRLTLALPHAGNMAALADALAKLVPLGLDVDQHFVRERLGLPDPHAGATLLKSREKRLQRS